MHDFFKYKDKIAIDQVWLIEWPQAPLLNLTANLEFSNFHVESTGFSTLRSGPTLRLNGAGELAITWEARPIVWFFTSDHIWIQSALDYPASGYLLSLLSGNFLRENLILSRVSSSLLGSAAARNPWLDFKFFVKARLNFHFLNESLTSF